MLISQETIKLIGKGERMKNKLALILTIILFVGCSTYDVNYMRQSKNDNLSEVFQKTKKEVYEAVKDSLSQTDLIIRKDDFGKGEIVTTPNRLHSFAKRLVNTSYIGVYFFITPQDDGKTKLEIVQVYDNPMNVGREYKTGLLQGVRGKLGQ